MRSLIAFLAVSLATGCIFPTGSRYGSDNCTAGTDQWGNPCNYNGPGGAVITIGPSGQYADNADTLCYQLSPTPASVPSGGSYYFRNNTSSNITILGINQTPWVTIAAGATSGPLNNFSPGVYGFGVQGCSGVAGTAWYGVLDVTIN
jgi:hypothetical protein